MDEVEYCGLLGGQVGRSYFSLLQEVSADFGVLGTKARRLENDGLLVTAVDLTSIPSADEVEY